MEIIGFLDLETRISETHPAWTGPASFTECAFWDSIFWWLGNITEGIACQLVVLKYILCTALYLGFKVSLTTSFNFLLFFSHCKYKYLICFCSKYQLGISIIFINTDLLLQGDC